ncbi:hypothetical protein Tco_0015887 [Tanacetum coccineum]
MRPHRLQHHFPEQDTSDSDSDSVALEHFERQPDHLEWPEGIVDIVVIAGLLIKKDIVETGHVMIGHEKAAISVRREFDIVSNCFCFNVVIDDLVDVFGSSLKHNIGYTDICIISLFLRVTLILIAQQLEPKLYDGNVIEKTNAIVIPDSEETLMLAEESRSKNAFKTKGSYNVRKES